MVWPLAPAVTREWWLRSLPRSLAGLEVEGVFVVAGRDSIVAEEVRSSGLITPQRPPIGSSLSVWFGKRFAFPRSSRSVKRTCC
jgi:hypothetical protein